MTATLEDYDPAVHIGNYIENEKLISKKTNKSDEIIIEEHKKLKYLFRNRPHVVLDFILLDHVIVCTFQEDLNVLKPNVCFWKKCLALILTVLK